MIDDNKDNPPLHYFKSDYQKIDEIRVRWKIGCLTGIVTVIASMILEAMR
jgi:hypothetical protein